MAGFVVSKLDVCNVSSNTAVMGTSNLASSSILMALLFSNYAIDNTTSRRFQSAHMCKHVSVLSYLAGKTFVKGIQCRQRLTTLLHQGQHTHTPQPVADGGVGADVTQPGQ